MLTVNLCFSGGILARHNSRKVYTLVFDGFFPNFLSALSGGAIFSMNYAVNRYIGVGEVSLTGFILPARNGKMPIRVSFSHWQELVPERTALTELTLLFYKSILVMLSLHKNELPFTATKHRV